MCWVWVESLPAMPTHTMATGVVAMLVGDSVFRCLFQIRGTGWSCFEMLEYVVCTISRSKSIKSLLELRYAPLDFLVCA